MFTMDNNNVIITDVEQKIYSIYALIYENTDLLDHIEDVEYRTEIKNYILKLKEQLNYYKQLKYLQVENNNA